MTPKFLAQLTSAQFHDKAQRQWYLFQVRHYYRAQIERIQTLKLHVAKVVKEADREDLSELLRIAREGGAQGMRGLQEAKQIVETAESSDVREAGFALIGARLEQLRMADRTLCTTFEGLSYLLDDDLLSE